MFFILWMYINSYMKLKILLVFSLILLMLTLGAVSAQDNSTDDIAHGEDGDVLEKAVSGNTFKDIQTTVSSCNDGDTVELNGEYSSLGSPISISKSITIDGNGATLNAGKKSSILKVTSKNLTLKNIKNKLNNNKKNYHFRNAHY